MDKISVIVPCFNEEDVLPLFYKEVTHVLKILIMKYFLSMMVVMIIVKIF